MKAVYYAFDGKDFDDEDECQEYELELMRRDLGVKMLDGEGNDAEDLEQALFVYVPNGESYKKLADYAERIGLAYPSKEGLWEWNENCRWAEAWSNIDNHINKLKSELDKLESIKRKCEIGE